MTYTEAVQLIVEDVRQSYPEVTVEEAMEHVKQTVSLDGGIGSEALVDYEDELTEAYRLILA